MVPLNVWILDEEILLQGLHQVGLVPQAFEASLLPLPIGQQTFPFEMRTTNVSLLNEDNKRFPFK